MGRDFAPGPVPAPVSADADYRRFARCRLFPLLTIPQDHLSHLLEVLIRRGLPAEKCDRQSALRIPRHVCLRGDSGVPRDEDVVAGAYAVVQKRRIGTRWRPESSYVAIGYLRTLSASTTGLGTSASATSITPLAGTIARSRRLPLSGRRSGQGIRPWGRGRTPGRKRWQR